MDNEAGYDLVMPFVVCQSAGGPYEDEAFCAGYHLGQIDNRLGTESPPTFAVTVRTESVPQVDLIAMRHRYRVETKESEDYPEWTFVLFVRPAANILPTRFPAG